MYLHIYLDKNLILYLHINLDIYLVSHFMFALISELNTAKLRNMSDFIN